MKTKKPSKQQVKEEKAKDLKKQIDDLRAKWDSFDNYTGSQQLITKQITKLQNALKALTGEVY